VARGTTALPEYRHDEWETRVARVLARLPPRLRPPVAWLARQWVGRLLARTTAALVRVQIFDRAMTLAAQIFTSVFPLLILVGTLVGGATARRLADWALSHSGLAAFGVVGSLVVLLSSTGLARALTRAYAAVLAVHRVPAGPRASWRWLATVLVLAAYAVGSRLLDGLTKGLPRLTCGWPCCCCSPTVAWLCSFPGS
jgi:membrane protein